MRSLAKHLVLTTVFAVLFASPAMGWNDVGHKITGYIAWQRLSTTARANVIRILRDAPEDSHLGAFYEVYGPEPEEARRLEYFMFAATWADVVRDRSFERRYRNFNKSNWHYDDTLWRQVNGSVEVLSGLEEGGQAVPRLVEFDSVIRKSSASNADKAIAIAWIMHLSGDIHQPLHTSARVTNSEPKGDQGGNLFILSPAGASREDQLNLHWFWDSIVSRSFPIRTGMCGPEYIEIVGKRIMKKHPFATMQAKLQLGQYNDWMKESFAYNNTVVFSPELKRNELPSAQYTAKAFKLAEQQLALAGYRLGETLNSVFGGVAATVK